MDSKTELHDAIAPLIDLQIQAALNRYSLPTSGSSSGGSIDTSAFLRKTGDVITGNMGVSPGVTVDGVDISVLALNAVPLGLSVATTNTQTGSGHTHAVASSSYPGAAASLMATTSAGLVGVQGLGLGNAGQAGYGLYANNTTPHYLYGSLNLGTTYNPSNAQLRVYATPTNTTGVGIDLDFRPSTTTTGTYYHRGLAFFVYPSVSSGATNSGYVIPLYSEALRLSGSSDAGTLQSLIAGLLYFGHYNTSASAVTNIATGLEVTPYINTGSMGTLTALKLGAKVGSGTITGEYRAISQEDAAAYNYLAADTRIGTAAIGGKLHVLSTTEQARWSYSASAYASHTVASTGTYTIATTHGTPSGAHILLTPGGNVGINLSSPARELEVRSNTAAQQRWSYDATAYADLMVNAGGNATLTTYGSSIIVDPQPTGGIAGLKFVRPQNSYDVNLGQWPDKKWLSLYAAELVVENLIAFDTQATTGGRLLITPSTQLTSDLMASGAMSTIVHAGSSSAAISTNSAAWSLSVPVGAAAGDFLIAVVSTQAAATITPSAGWTQIGTTQSWTGGRQLAVYRKFMALGETAYAFTLSASTTGTWAVSAYLGVDPTTPVDASAFQANTGTTSHVAPTVTTTTTGDMLLFVGAYNNNAASMTAPGSMTERIDTPYAAGFNVVYIASQLLSASGATGTRTGTTSGSNDSVMANIALIPANASVPTVLYSKYNNMSTGDILRFEGGGKVEFMSVASDATGSGPYAYTVNRSIDPTGPNDWYAGDMAVNTGQAGNGWIDAYAWWSAKGTPIEFIFNIANGVFSANLSGVQNFAMFKVTAPQVGDAIYYGMGGGMWNTINHWITAISGTGFTGVLEYHNGSAWTALVSPTTTHYNPSTGASTALTAGYLPTTTGQVIHNWVIASQTGWAKTTVNSVSAYWVRWRCTANTSTVATQGYRRVVRGSAQYGPTIEGVVRQSSTFNDWDTRWAIGNLHGKYDYGKTSYGFAAGRYAAAWVSVDADSGFRIMNGIAALGQWDTTGKITIGQVTNGESRVEISPAGRLSIYNRVGGVDSERFYVSVAGDLGLYGNGSNYLTINGTTGVMEYSGAINVINGTINTGSNILYNSSLAIDSNADGIPDGWGEYNNSSGAQPATKTVQATGGVDNGAFYRIAWVVANTTTKGIVAAPSTVKNGWKANTTYVVSFWAKASGTNIGQTMGLYWNTAPSIQTQIVNPALTSSWQRYAWRIAWGASADTQLFISIANGSGTTGNLDIDQIQAEEGAVLTAWKPSIDELLPGAVSWSTGISGRPIDNNGLLTAAPTPAGAGLHLGSTLMGFYSGGQWRTYMDNSGNFVFRGAPSASVNVGALWWDTSSGLLRGGYYAPLAGPSYGSFSTQWYTDALTGAIVAGGGKVTIDSTGAMIQTSSNAYSAPSAYKFREQSTTIGYVWAGGANTSSGSAGQIVNVGLAALASSYAAAVLNASNLAGSAAGGAVSAIYDPANGIVNARVRVEARSDTFSMLGSANASNLYFTTSWYGYAGAAAAEISNDVGTYKTLMIVGNTSAGGVRSVSVWDKLTVNGDFTATGAMGTAWATLSYAANWASIGGVYRALQYKKVGDLVFVRGTAQRNTSNAAAGSIIATLPSGYRPTARIIVACAANATGTSTPIRIDVDTGGNIINQDHIINNGNWVSLEFCFSNI